MHAFTEEWYQWTQAQFELVRSRLENYMLVFLKYILLQLYIDHLQEVPSSGRQKHLRTWQDYMKFDISVFFQGCCQNSP